MAKLNLLILFFSLSLISKAHDNKATQPLCADAVSQLNPLKTPILFYTKRPFKKGEIKSVGVVLGPGEKFDPVKLNLEAYGEYIYLLTNTGHLIISPRVPHDATEKKFFASHLGLVLNAQKNIKTPFEIIGAGEFILTDANITKFNNKSGLLRGNLVNLENSARDFDSRGMSVWRDQAAFKDFSDYSDESHLTEIKRAQGELRWRLDPKLNLIRKNFEMAYSAFIKKNNYNPFVQHNFFNYFYKGEPNFEEYLKIKTPIGMNLYYVAHDGVMTFLIRSEEISGLGPIEALTQELNTLNSQP
ncbi:MAG: hypothetical protein KA116_07440 [Proteobacteria bacterium]|nr:hypothetical protein [Pseudomonadota bacterium]